MVSNVGHWQWRHNSKIHAAQLDFRSTMHGFDHSSDRKLVKAATLSLNIARFTVAYGMVATITATARGTWQWGQHHHQLPPIVAGFENSDIIANAVNGRGGNIQITTQGIFGTEVSATTDSRE